MRLWVGFCLRQGEESWTRAIASAAALALLALIPSRALGQSDQPKQEPPAAEAAAVQTPLRETLSKTYQTNPDLAAERARVREVDEGVSQANAKWRPSISLEAEVERSSDHLKSGFAK